MSQADSNCFECFHCKKMFAKPQNPLISDLPKEQFAINKKPFSKTGIDYFGPRYVKTSRRTQSTRGNNRRYGVLFTCLTMFTCLTAVLASKSYSVLHGSLLSA